MHSTLPHVCREGNKYAFIKRVWHALDEQLEVVTTSGSQGAILGNSSVHCKISKSGRRCRNVRIKHRNSRPAWDIVRWLFPNAIEMSSE